MDSVLTSATDEPRARPGGGRQRRMAGPGSLGPQASLDILTNAGVPYSWGRKEKQRVSFRNSRKKF